MMNDKFENRVKQFNDAIKEANILSSIARDSDLQRAAIVQLANLAVDLKDWKQEAISARNEERANEFLGMECFVRAMSAELNMWLLLKAEKPDDAWRELISAQTETNHAIRAHKAFATMIGHAKYLDAVEHVVFPPQKYLSAGLIVRRQLCTICDSDYEDCPHLVGMPYWGEFCFRRLMECEPDHIAMVDDPANKLCRITHFNVEGGKRNRMTWRIEPISEQEQQVGEQKGLSVNAILASTNDFVS